MTSSTPFLDLMMFCSKSFLKSVSGTDKYEHCEPNEHEVSWQAW